MARPKRVPEANTILHEIVRASPEIVESTRKQYLSDLDAWVLFAGTSPECWTRNKAQDFYTSLLTRGMRPQSANRLFASLKYASTWYARRANDANLDFALIMQSKPARVIQKHALTPETAIKLLDTCADQQNPLDLRDRALITIALETGMRCISLRSMLIESTMLSQNAPAIIQNSMRTQTTTPYPHASVLMKGKASERTSVPLSDAAISTIIPWLSWLASAKKRHGALLCAIDKRTDPRSGRNFFVPTERALSNSALQKIASERGDQAGIGHLHPHMWRHTFITWRSMAGFLPYEIAAVTGHKIVGLGAMAGYIDLVAIGAKMRASTPEWLSRYLGVTQ